MNRTITVLFCFNILLVSVESAAAPSTPVAFASTLPDASCAIHPDGQTEPSGEVFSDHAGIARFYEPPLSWGRKLLLDCTSPDGTNASTVVDLDQSVTYQVPAGGQVTALPKIRQPLTGDLTKYSANELIAMGFPPRPSQGSSLYPTWVQIVSQRVVVLPFQPIARLDKMPEIQSNNNKIWGGPFLDQKGLTYALANASFTAPPVTNPGTNEMAMWVGLGGTPAGATSCGGTGTSSPLIQAGIAYEVGYYAWIEYIATNQPQQIVSVDVFPSDSMFVAVWASDQFGDINVAGGYGSFYLQDSTQNWVMEPQPVKAPSGSTFVGNTADYIIERETLTNSQGQILAYEPLVDYGSASMTIIAQDSTGNDNHNFSSDTTVVCNLVDQSNLPMENASATSDVASFSWIRSN